MDLNRLAGNGSKLSSFLISLGYSQSQAEHYLYVKSYIYYFTAIPVYVDDIVLAGNYMSEIQSVKTILDQKLKIKYIGKIGFFLGFQISRSTNGIFINWRKYNLELLKDTGFLASKPSYIPFDPNHKLSPTDGELLEYPTLYRILMGRLIYFKNNMPDISFAVQHLSQYVSTPLVSHYQATNKVLRFLKYAHAKGILLPLSSLKLYAFADYDWARCRTTRKYITSFCVILGSSLLC